MDASNFVSGYCAFSLKLPSPIPGGASPRMIAEFTLCADVFELAPYINSVAQKAMLYEKPPHIRFVLDSILCTLFENRGSASSFCDRNQALDFMENLVVFLNRIHRNRDSIRPNYKIRRPGHILNLFRILPRSNCGECGFASCMAFAVALSRKRAPVSLCRGFGRPQSLQAVYPVLNDQGRLISSVAIDIDSPPGVQTYAEKIDSVANDLLPAPLTGRELGVLRLMAEGATNREISTSLHISPHTVKSHITHIFNKLGVYDRTRAAVWAAHHDLV
ncbi:MAG: LuxR C-terminal-related transcriptional regulator [Syntrophobacteraceae bacterium]|nr:LuxR C-terminal-related transcriptional regulator [Syntrophobacteraceae bacterium]